MSSKEHSDPKFREAVDMQWENIDKCIDDTIDRNNPDFSNYFEMESSENRNLIREHAGIHGLPPTIYRVSS